MQTKPISERIAELRSKHDKLMEKEVSSAATAFALGVMMMEALEILEQFPAKNEAWQKVEAENQALLAKNKELEAENKTYHETAAIILPRNRFLNSENIRLENKIQELEGKMELVRMWFEGAALDQGFTKESCKVNAEQIAEWSLPAVPTKTKGV